MADPFITVAVPTCNGARHLREALESILRSPVPFDLIVVDDRSDDETTTIARDLIGDRGRVVVNPERRGLAGNWNRCVEMSMTPVVAIFHQDDVMLPGHLETHVEAHRANPRFGWVASNADVIDDAGWPVPESVVERGGLGDRDYNFEHVFFEECFLGPDGIPPFAVSNPLRCSAVSISREAHTKIGGFDPIYRYVVDWDFWIRVAEQLPVAWRARTTTAIRWHPASETHRFAKGTADIDEAARMLQFYKEAADCPFYLYPGWFQVAERRLARAFLNRAHVSFKAGDPSLARRALLRAFRLAPDRTPGQLTRDPRLLAQMALSILFPWWVRRPNRTGVPSELLSDRLESGDNG